MRALSHLALWPGLYVASGVVYILQLIPPEAATSGDVSHLRPWWCLAFAFLTGVGTYLLDRVKLRNAWLDPADERAHPQRYSFIARHATPVRISAFACLIVAMVIAWTRASQHWLLAIPMVSAAGVVAYAAKPRRITPRLKDVLVVKNAYVSGGIAGFGAVVAWCWFHMGIQSLADVWPVWAFATATLAARVFADAVLCDLDDEAADRQFGTTTFPTTLGRTNAWNAAMVLRLAIAAALIAVPLGPVRARVAWAAATVTSSVGLRVMKPRKVRDWVDARFALEATAVWACVAIGSLQLTASPET